MSIRDVLASRIRALMEARATLDTQTKLAIKAKLGQSTVQRILAKEASATIDSVESIADAFGVQPVELLSEPPEKSHLLALWSQLTDTDRKRVLSFIEVSIEADKAGVKHIEFSRSRALDPGQITRIQAASSEPLQPEKPTDAGHDNGKRTGRGRS